MNFKILENKFFVIYLIPFFLGLITVFSFQPFNFTIINFFSITCLFLILSYVNKKIKKKYRKKNFLKNFFFIGYFFGIGFFLSNTYWISNSLSFDENLKFLIPFTIVCLPLVLGAFFGISCFLIGPRIENNLASIILFVLIFSLTDFLRSYIFTGFPWNLWAYSWSWSNESLQSLNFLGLHGFNLLSITLFCMPAILFKKNFNYKSQFFLTFLTIFLTIYIYGSFKINSYKDISFKNAKLTNFKIISPGFNLNYDFSDKYLNTLADKLIRYSNPEKEKKTIFIWPEGVFAGFYFSEIQILKKRIEKNFSKNHLIIFGVNTKSSKKNKTFNSLVVVNNKFEIIYKYDKIKLVPFGEFIPLKNFLSKFGLKKITYGYDTFTKGDEKDNFTHEGINLLPLICYEVIFPNIVQRTSASTNLIVNISEDAWFGTSIGPAQHFSKAKFRAIENNNYLLRSANKGYSAIISNTGEVLKSLKPSEIGSIEMKIPLEDRNNKNKNDLIFFIILITYILTYFMLKRLK